MLAWCFTVCILLSINSNHNFPAPTPRWLVCTWLAIRSGTRGRPPSVRGWGAPGMELVGDCWLSRWLSMFGCACHFGKVCRQIVVFGCVHIVCLYVCMCALVCVCESWNVNVFVRMCGWVRLFNVHLFPCYLLMWYCLMHSRWRVSGSSRFESLRLFLFWTHQHQRHDDKFSFGKQSDRGRRGGRHRSWVEVHQYSGVWVMVSEKRELLRAYTSL
jgi:hypothetical protein